MIQRKRITIIVIVCVAAAIGAGMVSRFSSAKTVGVDWTSRQPSVAIEKEHGAEIPPTGIKNCSNMSVRLADGTPTDLCMTPTAMGNMTEIFSNWGHVQPTGWPHAYQIHFKRGGNPVVHPVPNQASGIYFSPASSANWVHLGLVYQIANKLTLGGLPPTLSYSTNSDMADMLFRHPNGDPIRFDYVSDMFNFSPNGRYMLAKTQHGMVRIGVMDTSVRYVNRFTSLGTEATAINDTGTVVFRGAIHNDNPQDGSLVFTDIGTCDIPAPHAPDSPRPDYSSCKQIEVFPRLKQAVPDVRLVSTARFVNERTMTMIVGYGSPMKYATVSMTADGHVRSLKSYLALGDSFISGEGAANYRKGTDSERNQCHQSTSSYPYLLGGRKSSFASVACSGARMNNIYAEPGTNPAQLRGGPASDAEKSEASESYLPGYAEQSEYVRRVNPDAVTVSIGGNDIGFASILKRCINPLENFADSFSHGFVCYRAYEDRKELTNLIDRQFHRLRDVYSRLKNEGAGNTRVYAIGYPQIVKPGGQCDINVRLSSRETKFAHDLVNYLNGVIRRAADEAGVLYVDTGTALNGHRLCEASGQNVAVNGVTIRPTPVNRWNMSESFHPNRLGHELLERKIAEQTDDLTRPMPVKTANTPSVPADPTNPIYAGVVAEGRAVSKVEFVDSAVPSLLTISQTVQVDIDVSAYGFKQGGTYMVHIGGSFAGAIVVGADGRLTGQFKVPSGVPDGFQTIRIGGEYVFGGRTDLQQTVYIGVVNGDADGDQVPDSEDSCPFIVNSRFDTDEDGIDDACDSDPSGPTGDVAPGPDAGEGIVWWANAVMPVTIHSNSGP